MTSSNSLIKGNGAVDVIATDATSGAAMEARQLAARQLAAGGLVIIPTETVYGLAADATQAEAIAALYAAKGRPAINPLIAHVETMDRALQCGVFNDMARRLAEAFWPGPLTLVVPRAETCPVALIASAGLDTIALRMPAHPVMRGVIAALDRPVVAPSANISGRITATRLADALADLGGAVALGIDDGTCEHGIESTIIASIDETPRLLRPGALALEAIEAVAGPIGRPAAIDDSAPAAPGMLSSHYAPGARVRLNANEADARTAFIDFGGTHAALRPHALAYADLSPAGDIAAAAAILFETLRAMDAKQPALIAVAPIPDDGLGLAINDRLRRAAAPR